MGGWNPAVIANSGNARTKSSKIYPSSYFNFFLQKQSTFAGTFCCHPLKVQDDLTGQIRGQGLGESQHANNLVGR